MPTPINLSVALATRNRPESLRRCLTSLRSQSHQPFEIVISDDSDPTHTSATQNLAREWDCRYLSGPRRGLYANRNHLAQACLGTHIRTMDDDHTFPPGHVKQCLQALEEDPQSIWTAGETSFINGQHYASTTTANQLHPSGVGTAVLDPDDNWAIADGATIYPREVFDRKLHMIEDFPFGSSYLEFGAYLYRHGYRSRCLSGVQVEHHADETTLHRGEDQTVRASCLFASLCFNLFFRPNPLQALRYTLTGLLSANPTLALDLPSLTRKARQRWCSAPAGH